MTDGGVQLFPDNPLITGTTVPQPTTGTTDYGEALKGRIEGVGGTGPLSPDVEGLTNAYASMFPNTVYKRYAGKQYDSAVSTAVTSKPWPVAEIPQLTTGSNPVTWVMWVRKFTGAPGGTNVDLVGQRRPSGSSDRALQAVGTSGVRWDTRNTAGVQLGTGTAVRNISDGELHLVVGVMQLNHWVYVDETDALATSTWGDYTTYADQPLGIGGNLRDGPAAGITGEIWDVALLRGAVTPAQIDALWLAGTQNAVRDGTTVVPRQDEAVTTTTPPTTIARVADSTHTDETSNPFSTLANRISNTVGNLGDRLMSGLGNIAGAVGNGLSSLGDRVTGSIGWLYDLTAGGFQAVVEGLGNVKDAVVGGFGWLSENIGLGLVNVANYLMTGFHVLTEATLAVWREVAVVGEAVVQLPGQIGAQFVVTQQDFEGMKDLYVQAQEHLPFSLAIDVVTFVPDQLRSYSDSAQATGCKSVLRGLRPSSDGATADHVGGSYTSPGVGSIQSNADDGAICSDNSQGSVKAGSEFGDLRTAVFGIIVVALAMAVFRTVVGAMHR